MDGGKIPLFGGVPASAPKNPRPVANSGNAAGSGTSATVATAANDAFLIFSDASL
jgi:hypothetical protein